jgi:hypothetical protein
MDNKNKHDDSLCRQVVKLVSLYARQEGLPREEAEECGLQFLAKELIRGGMEGLAILVASEDILRRKAHSFARSCAIRRTRKSHREVSYEALESAEQRGSRRVLVSQEPGPEERMMIADVMDQLLAALSELPLDQHQMFLYHFLEGKRLIEMQEETGRSADALWHALMRICKRLQKVLEGKGLTTAEIDDLRNMLDRWKDSR